jgi:hypothetical protein
MNVESTRRDDKEIWDRLSTLFLRSVAALLFLTACAKAWSSLGSAAILHQRDVLLQIDNRYVLLLGAILEIGVVAYLIKNSDCIARLTGVRII